MHDRFLVSGILFIRLQEELFKEAVECGKKPDGKKETNKTKLKTKQNEKEKTPKKKRKKNSRPEAPLISE